MMGAREYLARERARMPLVAAIAAASALTGFLTYFFNTHSAWLQWSVLAHVGTGIAFAFVVAPYLYFHLRRTLVIRRFFVLFTGLIALLVVLGLLGSGWAMMLIGQREASHWVYALHLAAAAVLLAFVPLHLLLHVIGPSRRSSDSEGAFASVPRGTVKFAVRFTAGAQVVVVAAAAAYAVSVPKYSEKPATGTYEYSYGEHRFRPSHTETTNNAFIDKRQIAESRRCIGCHEDVADQWFASAHRHAASDAAYVTNINLLVQKRGIAAGRYCEGCHAPVALLSGELSPGGKHGGVPGTASNIEGVSCMGCHGIESLVHIKGVASYKWKGREDYLFGQSDNPIFGRIHDLLIRVHPDQHKADLGKPLFRDPKMCASCHAQFMDKSFNNWGWVKMQDDYSAWLKSPYSKQHEESFSQTTATRCNDCHMPLVPSHDPSADVTGRIRSHRFLGANTFLPMIDGDAEQLALTKSFLQADKLRVSIEQPNRKDALQNLQALAPQLRNYDEAPYYYYLGEKAKLSVTVSNRGVGHNFPGGTLDINESWVELVVMDSEAREVYASGLIGEDNHVDPKANFYLAMAVDKKGEHVWRHDLFNMVGESYRRVVPAGGSDVIEYTFDIPAWAKSPLTVTASLRYRKLNERYARWALRDKYVKIPAVNVAWASLDIPIRLRQEVN
jgi:hypothetical protein